MRAKVPAAERQVFSWPELSGVEMVARNNRKSEVRGRVDLLIRKFESCVKCYLENPPFTRYGQFEFHKETIARRKNLGSAIAAIHDTQFQRSLYKTLQAWGIGSRGSKLAPFSEFASAFCGAEEDIQRLDGLLIDQLDLEPQEVSDLLWKVMDSLHIVNNEAKVVATSKALHHILPDLVVPIDREYTSSFFGWHAPEFQNHQSRCFCEAFRHFVRIAEATNPSKYVGDGWNTSRSKVIDNALVGLFVLANSLAAKKGSSKCGQRRNQSTI